MGSRTAYSQYNWEKLIKKGADYLLLNFHKFSKQEKIHISLELIKRVIPQVVDSKSDVNVKVTINEVSLTERKEVVNHRLSQCPN